MGVLNKTADECLRDIMEGLDGIVWEADARTLGFSMVSERAESVLGYPVEQWFRESDFWSKHLHPDDRAAALEAFRAVAAGGGDRHLEHRAVAADGRIRWFRTEFHPVHAAGAVREVLALMVDVTDRHIADCSLQFEHDVIAAACAAAAQPVAVLDREGRVVYWNAACELATGRALVVARGRPFAALVASVGEARALEAAIERARITGIAAEALSQCPAGSVRGPRLIEWACTPAGGVPHHVVCVGTVIGAHERRETADPGARLHQEMLFHQLPAMVWTTDRELRFTTGAGAVLAQLGVQFGHLVGTSLLTLFGTDDLAHPAVALSVRALAGERQVTDLELLGRTLQLTVEPLRTPDGGVAGTMGFAIDVTEQRAAEADLRASGLRYRAIFDQTFQLTCVLALDGTVIDVNRTGLEFLQLRSEDVVGRKCWELAGVPQGAVDTVRAHVQAALRGEAARFELELGLLRGRATTVDLSFRPLLGPTGRVDQVIVEGRDVTARTRYEKQLNDARRQTQDVVDGVDGIVWEADADTLAFSFVAGQAERLLGYPRSAWLNEPDFWRDHLHPDDREWASRFCRETAAKAVPHQFEYRLVAADGHAVWVRDFVTVHVEDGRPSKLRGVMVDVTELKAAERGRQRALSLLEATLDATTDGILVVDQVGRITRYNRQFVELWRIPHAVLAAGDDASALSFVLDQLVDREAFEARVRELYRRPEAESHDVVDFKDGRVFERYSKPQRVDGRVVGRVWSFRDVTPRRRAERERDRLLLEEKRARAAAEGARLRASFLAEASRALGASLDQTLTLETLAQIAVPYLADWCIVDELTDGVAVRRAITHADPAHTDAARALRALAPDVRGHGGLSRVLRTGLSAAFPSSAGRKSTPEALSRWLAAGIGRAVITDAVRALGAASALAVPIVARGKTLGALTLVSAVDPARYGAAERGVAEDLARRAALAVDNARLYRAASDALHMRDEFLSIAAHEFRTPITSIQLAGESIKRAIAKAAPAAVDAVASKVDLLLSQCRRLTRQVNDLLDVSRIQAGRFELVVDEVDLGGLARDAAARLEPQVSGAGCALTLRVERAVGRWDRARLEQVVTNLLSNAMKYGAGKPIEVEVLAGRGGAVLSVVDHGIGIAPEAQARIFGRFERAVSARHFGGLGLGLYIVRQIVDSHGGTIRVESTPGNSTVFTVELPWASPAQPTLPDSIPSHS